MYLFDQILHNCKSKPVPFKMIVATYCPILRCSLNFHGHNNSSAEYRSKMWRWCLHFCVFRDLEFGSLQPLWVNGVVYNCISAVFAVPLQPSQAASATYAVMRCPSICLSSRSCIVSKLYKHILKLFLPSVRHTVHTF